MDPTAIIAAIESAIKLASLAVQAEQSVQPYAVALYNSLFGKTDITQADLDTLEVSIDALSAEFQTPLPPDDGTTTS